MNRLLGTLTLVSCFGAAIAPNAYGSLVATYTFDNTLAAQEAGVTALTAVDPTGTSGYQTETVFGNSRVTYNFNGTASPSAMEGGLDLSTTGLITDTYSVEMVLSLTSDIGWRRLLDALDRQSDNGLYIDPNNNLADFPNPGGSGSPFTSNSFFDVFVTVSPTDIVTGYLNGVQQFSVPSTNFVIATSTLGFFLDNTVSGGTGEWSSGNVALIKIFNSVLTPDQVAAESGNPFPAPVGTVAPEPGSWVLVLSAIAATAMFKRHGFARKPR